MVPSGRLHRYTYADYVALEDSSSTKHEYLAGEIYAIAGGSEEHSALAAEVLRAIGNAVGGIARRHQRGQASVVVFDRRAGGGRDLPQQRDRMNRQQGQPNRFAR